MNIRIGIRPHFGRSRPIAWNFQVRRRYWYIDFLWLYLEWSR